MTGAGFEVTPGDLYGAADEFASRSETVLTGRNAFRSDAALPASAFGNLDQSGQIAAAYAKFFNSVTGPQDGLAKLALALLDGTAKLALTATLYRAADEFAAEHAQLPAGQAEALDAEQAEATGGQAG